MHNSGAIPLAICSMVPQRRNQSQTTLSDFQANLSAPTSRAARRTEFVGSETTLARWVLFVAWTVVGAVSTDKRLCLCCHEMIRDLRSSSWWRRNDICEGEFVVRRGFVA